MRTDCSVQIKCSLFEHLLVSVKGAKASLRKLLCMDFLRVEGFVRKNHCVYKYLCVKTLLVKDPVCKNHESLAVELCATNFTFQWLLSVNVSVRKHFSVYKFSVRASLYCMQIPYVKPAVGQTIRG